jgi:DNA-binding transcriptional MocR family regulator
MSKDWRPRLSDRSGPSYVRLIEALREDVNSGRLPAGVRLPTHRALAKALGLSLGTVTRAYAGAQTQNLVAGEPGRGVYVSASAPLGNEDYPTRLGGETFFDLRLNQPAVNPDGAFLNRALMSLSKSDASRKTLIYDFAPGASSYRLAMSKWIRLGGVHASPDHIVLCNGTQQALFASLATFAGPGDRIATEGLNYPGLRQIARTLKLSLVAIDIDEEGMVPDSLEKACADAQIQLIVCTPRGHNPTTASMSLARLKSIAKIAERYGTRIIEDDVYGPLSGDRSATLFNITGGKTVYLGGLSKALAPGLRLGFILSPPTVLSSLVGTVRAMTWSSSALSAELFAELTRQGAPEAILSWHRREIKLRHAVACDVFRKCELSISPGCYHAWLKIPSEISLAALVALAQTKGLLLSDSSVFQMDKNVEAQALRICLGAPDTRRLLRTALELLATLIASDTRPHPVV